MVPENWNHPKDEKGNYIPLHTGYKNTKNEFLEMVDSDGLQRAIEYFGRAPNKNDYMPEWSKKKANYLMMYEDCTEGTPISPAFKSPEELAQWLADNNASAFGGMTATYEQWLATCKAGWVPSAMVINGVLKSGVESE